MATPITSEDYINGKLWQHATLNACPWHPKGGCGFSRHGTYSRVKPANTRVARWYCPKAKHTVSALPDCLASHRSGTLEECEAIVRTVERCSSREIACQFLRTDIELPGALRYVARLVRDIHQALAGIKGLYPLRFTQMPTIQAFSEQVDHQYAVLMSLRQISSPYLHQLPTPLGFNPSRNATHTRSFVFQHRAGRDPPAAFIEAPC